MRLRGGAGVLLLGLAAAGCGEDATAARECTQPRNPKHQVEACSRVISANAKSAEALNNRCQAYNQLEDTNKAIADCNAALKLEPRNASAFNNRGWSYEIKREYDLALADYTKAIEINSRFALAYANRGDVYFKKGDKQKAATEYRLALEIDPQNDVAANGMKRLGLR
jgi:tetratricopeptide (TPR) repeat protein